MTETENMSALHVYEKSLSIRWVMLLSQTML